MDTKWEVATVSQKTWHPEIPGGPFYYVQDEIGTICDLYVDTGPSFVGFNDAEKHAKLIAEAPAMYEALGRLLKDVPKMATGYYATESLSAENVVEARAILERIDK